MIMKERLPPLRWWGSSPDHILGHARLADIDTELEQFAMDPRCAPQRIGNAHFADQLADLQRHNRPATTASRLPTPIRPETRSMPADNSVRLNNSQSIANSRKQPIEPNEYQSVYGTEGEFLWSSPPQDVYLLPQRPNLRLKSRPRPEQIDNRPANKSAKIPHPTRGLPDSRSTASRMRFATGTILALIYIKDGVADGTTTGHPPRRGVGRLGDLVLTIRIAIWPAPIRWSGLNVSA